MGVSVYWPLSVVCVFVCLCVGNIKLEYQSKTHYASDLNELDTLLHKANIKVFQVLRYQDLTCVDLYDC